MVTDELATTAGGPQYVKGVLTFGADPLIPDGKAVVEKFRAGGFEPEGYTLYSYASISPWRRPSAAPAPAIRPRPPSG